MRARNRYEVAFAISVAYVYSVATVFGLKGMDFFPGTGHIDFNNAAGPLDRNEICCRRIKGT